MQRVKYIYSGSSTRKLQISGRQSVIISGDSDSTVFDFTFPNEYKDYTKTIIWDCYCENEDGDIINPRYVIKNDVFTVPYEITSNNAGLQISFVISLASPSSDSIETSLPSPVYITRATHSDKCKVTSDVLSQLSSRAFVDAVFEIVADEEGVKQPSIAFSNIADKEVLKVYLSDIPYLENGKIPKSFISSDQIVELFPVSSKDDLTSLSTAVSPDMGIITEGDEAGDIYILKSGSPEDISNWTPIYSESRLKKLEENKVDKEVGKGLSSNDFTDELKSKLEDIDPSEYAIKAEVEEELDKKVDKEEGKGLSSNDFTTELKNKLEDIDLSPLATKDEVAEGLDKKVDKEDGKSLISDTLITKLDGIEDGAQVNLIEVVKRNGTVLNITDKAVDIEVPTKVIDLSDAGDYATLDTDKLTNYYLSSKVDELIEEAKSQTKVEQTDEGIVIGGTALQVASDTKVGLMDSAMVVQLNKAVSDITSIGTELNDHEQRISTNAGNINSLSTELGTISENLNEKIVALSESTDTRFTEVDTKLASKQNVLTQGDNILIVEEDGKTIISATAEPLQPATETTLGGVIVGNKLSVTPEGVISVSELAISDITGLTTSLDSKASVEYVDGELAKKQNILTVKDGELTLSDTNVLSIDSSYVESQLEEGENIRIAKNSDTGKLKISATGDIAVGWGNISGEIHAQSDLVSKSILTWDSSTTYAINGMVIYSGKIYTSLASGNVGNVPSTSPDAWKVLDTDSKPTTFTKTIGDGVSSSITVTHNLDSQDVFVALRDVTDNTFVDALVTAVSVNEVKFSFTEPPAIDSLVAIISLGGGGSGSGGTIIKGWNGITWTTTSSQTLWEISLADFSDIPDRLLNVQTYDENGIAIEGYITQTKGSKVQIGFNEATKGTAVLN